MRHDRHGVRIPRCAHDHVIPATTVSVVPGGLCNCKALPRTIVKSIPLSRALRSSLGSSEIAQSSPFHVRLSKIFDTQRSLKKPRRKIGKNKTLSLPPP